MRFSAAALLAFAASAIAQTNPTEGFNPITKPEKDENVAAGTPFVITWQVADEYKDLQVDIELLGGNDPTTLVPLGKIASKFCSTLPHILPAASRDASQNKNKNR
jgi:hypothetical protein